MIELSRHNVQLLSFRNVVFAKKILGEGNSSPFFYTAFIIPCGLPDRPTLVPTTSINFLVFRAL